MRCKKDDLAYIIDAYLPETIGRLVRVERRTDDREYEIFYGPAWDCVAIGRIPGFDQDGQRFDANPGEVIVVSDVDLFPIRDPGDDAVDETLLWKPLPKEDALREELRARVKEMP